MTPRILAVPIALSLVLASNPVFAAAPALLEGSVSGEASLAAARVELADRDGAVVASTPVAEGGNFRMEGIPAGTYRLAVTTPSGAYAVGSTVALAPGSRQNVQIAVKQQTDAGAATPAAGSTSPSFWSTGWGKAAGFAMIAGGVLGVAALVDNTDDSPAPPPASPSQPE